MKTIAVIPVHGRLPLLKHTIERLYRKNGIFKVICVGSENERETCENAGAHFVVHDNSPLGKKWNAGFLEAKTYNPEACLFVGSSDWVCDDWLSIVKPYMDKYDMVGKAGFSLLDVGDQLRACHWSGYGKGHEREHEPIGIGRVLSKKILDKLNWEPIRNDIDRSIDFSMLKKVEAAGGKVAMIGEGTLLSISTDRWPNMHKFEEHWANKLPSQKISVVQILKQFPEALEV